MQLVEMALVVFVEGNRKTQLWWCLRRSICWWELFPRNLVPKPINNNNHWPQWHPLVLHPKPDSSNQWLVLEEDLSQTIRCFRAPQAICRHHPWVRHHRQLGFHHWRLRQCQWQPFSLLLPDRWCRQSLLPMALLHCLDSSRSSCLDLMRNGSANEGCLMDVGDASSSSSLTKCLISKMQPLIG